MMRYEIGSDTKDVMGRTVRFACNSRSKAVETCKAMALNGLVYWVYDSKAQDVIYTTTTRAANQR